MEKNRLYYGDNLDVLKRHIKDESVDLIYLDPPFKSNQDYNVLFAEQDGSRSRAQIKVFEDTWKWDQEAAREYADVIEHGTEHVSKAMLAFRTFLGDSDMMAYLAMMAPRLIELRRVLKKTGSIYLRCDPTASHYLKILMDAIFGPDAFQNEVVWHYRGGGVSKGRFGRRHDIIFFYGASNDRPFNVDKVRTPYSPESLERLRYKARAFRGDKVYDSYEPNPLGKHPDDVWDLQPIMPSAKERLGYPTQKPEALLERIILASSNEGDTILDPFCGCGTAVVVAQALKRHWVGIDITHLAIGLIKHRLYDSHGLVGGKDYEVIGEPTDSGGAKELAENDPYQFQWWALGLVGARPADQKKGADKGIDGRLYFHDEPDNGKTKQIIFSVKAGHTNVAHVRDLVGVLEREKAEMGVLLSLQDPTQPMRTEAASAGFYNSPWGTKHPRVQIFTVKELLDGKRVDFPPTRGNVTFKKAASATENGSATASLPL